MPGTVTVTLLAAVFVGSASLVAVIVSVPAADGAVYKPVGVIWPIAAVHCTDLSVAEPATLAENCSVPPVVTELELGVMVTDVTPGAVGVVGPVGKALAIFAAVADPPHPEKEMAVPRITKRTADRSTQTRSWFTDTRIM